MALLNAVSEIIHSSDSIDVPAVIIYEPIVHVCIKHQPLYRNFVIQKFLFCSFRQEKSNLSSCPECIVNRIHTIRAASRPLQCESIEHGGSHTHLCLCRLCKNEQRNKN